MTVPFGNRLGSADVPLPCAPATAVPLGDRTGAPCRKPRRALSQDGRGRRRPGAAAAAAERSQASPEVAASAGIGRRRRASATGWPAAWAS